jgi:hypothetical protein
MKQRRTAPELGAEKAKRRKIGAVLAWRTIGEFGHPSQNRCARTAPLLGGRYFPSDRSFGFRCAASVRQNSPDHFRTQAEVFEMF